MPPPSRHVGPGGFHLFFGLLLNLVFEPVLASPHKAFGLVGVGSGDLPERVKETLKVPRITLS